ncbi:SENP5 protease, partial [Polypterus senegalus]
MRNANEQVNLTIINGSCDADTDGSCGMDVDLSLQCSDPFQEQLQDHLYCKISSRFVTETIHTDDLRKGEKKVSRQLQSHEIGNEEMREIIHDFLEEFYGKYGSYIPLTENDVLEKLKQVLNTDVSDRKSFIFTEVMKYQATLAVVPMGNFKVTYNKHTLTLEDLSTLDGQNWLNDQVINMYGELIMDAVPHKVHFFNSFFYRQLATKGYEGVKRWTKKVDLFSKNLLLVPIHLQIHWSLITVDIPNQNIQLYDSQGIHIKFLLEGTRDTRYDNIDVMAENPGTRANQQRRLKNVQISYCDQVGEMVLWRMLATLLNNQQVIEKLSESRPIRRAAQITAFAITKAQITGKDAAEKLLRSETLRQIRKETADKMPQDAGELSRRLGRLRTTFLREMKDGMRDVSRQIKNKGK